MNTTAEAKDLSEQQPLYENYLNPQFVRLLDSKADDLRKTSPDRMFQPASIMTP
jgi:hypothetical protein